jgi:hypothetical protein
VPIRAVPQADGSAPLVRLPGRLPERTYQARAIEDRRDRIGTYLPPLLERLGLSELTHDPRNDSARALWAGDKEPVESRGLCPKQNQS